MRLSAVEGRVSQSDERKTDDETNRQNLLTPARRAALNALEREFRELLQAARASGAM
jgi:methanogenic corrinoid protein MtbC1